jgi:exosome complex component RRP4
MLFRIIYFTRFFRGHGTYLEDDILYSSVAGITDQVNKLLRVNTAKPRLVFRAFIWK